MLGQLAAAKPENPAYSLEIGQLQAELGRFGPAEEAFQDACRRAPQGVEGCVGLVQLYLKGNRKLPEAADLARKIVERKPVASSYALLGTARLENGDRAGAASAFQKALDLEPGNAQYRQRLQSVQEKPEVAHPPDGSH